MVNFQANKTGLQVYKQKNKAQFQLFNLYAYLTCLLEGDK